MKYLNICCWSLLLSFVAPVWADDDGKAKKKQRDAADTEARVYELIADLAVNLDDLENQRYAYVAKGTRLRDKKDKFDTSDVYWIAAQENPGKRLDANCYTSPSSALPVLMERWTQRIVDGGKFYVRSTTHNPQPAEEFKDKEEYDKSNTYLYPMHPLQQSVAPSVCLGTTGTPRVMFDVLIRDNQELKSAKYTEDGDILATFDCMGEWSIVSFR
jgi:hypothetical protein